jgi:uncharacterized membrane protein YidH (DUF202 family)
VEAADGAELRDRLASHRTLLAYIRTSLSFAGLGFAVAKFGLSPKTTHTGVLLGTFMVLVGLVFAVVGLLQHRAVLAGLDRRAAVPGSSGSLHAAAAIGSALVCALLAVYLLVSAT